MDSSLSSQKKTQPIPNFTDNLTFVNINSFLRPKEKVVFIMGTTGSGKSRLAIDLATRFQGEIINSDKIQFYKGLDVLINRITPEESKGVPHHLLGILDSEAGTLTAIEFSHLASQAISKISANNKLPIVAGGSNTYIETLANHSSGFLQNYECCFIWVNVAVPLLNSFVSKRVDRMMERGLLEEVRGMFNPEADYSVGIRRAIGVPELHDYLCNESQMDEATRKKMLDEAVENIKENTKILAYHQLQKIQRLRMTWKQSMHRVDATEVHLKNNKEESEEAWENLVLKQSVRILEEFINNKLKNNHCFRPIGAVSYGGVIGRTKVNLR